MLLSKIYVSPTGKDSYSGTISRPFKTLQKAVDHLKDKGGQILMRGGVYSPQAPTWITSGRENSPTLSISSYPGENAIIDGRNLPRNAIPLTIRDAHNLRISGLEVRNVQNHGIEVIYGKNIQIRKNLVHDTRGMGIRVRGYLSGIPGENDTTKKSANILIQGNTVYSTNLSNRGSNKGLGNWGMGIQVMNAHDVKVISNSVSNNYGEGIGLTLVDGGIVKNNTLSNNFSIQLYLDNASNIKVERNFIRETGNQEFWRNGNAAIGLGFANEKHILSRSDSPSRYYLNNLEITRNVIVGGNHSFIYGTWGGIHSDVAFNVRGLKNTIVAHNTLYGSRYEAIKISQDPNIANVKFVNNLAVKLFQGPLVEVARSGGTEFRSNLWSGGNPYNASHSSDIKQKPSFVNAGGSQYSDYKLKETSPGIDKGVILRGLHDQGSNPRPDIGAIESANLSFPRAVLQSNPPLDDGPAVVEEFVVDSASSDRRVGLRGNDSIFGGAGDNALLGRADSDVIKGQGGKDLIMGGVGADTLFGDTGSDRLLGGDDDDRLIGTSPLRQWAGKGEIDELTGGVGADTFVLGSIQSVFYDDGNENSLGDQDYALIQDFQDNQGDQIILKGRIQDYIIGNSSGILPTGKALYHVQNGTDELIAIIQTPSFLALEIGAFKFVGNMVAS